MARQPYTRFWMRFGSMGLSTSFDAFPPFTKFLVLLNAALDPPFRFMRQGLVGFVFGLILIPFSLFFLFGIPLIQVIGTVVFALVHDACVLVATPFTTASKVAAADQKSEPPHSAPLQGSITWRYRDNRPPDVGRVLHAVLRRPAVLNLECDCGTPGKPCLYAIRTESSDGVNFVGSYSTGTSPRDHSIGCCQGSFLAVDGGCRFQGLWYEGGEEVPFQIDLRLVADLSAEKR